MTLTPEQQALRDRERARMAEPGYRDRLVDPPADLLPRRVPSSDIGDEELATMAEWADPASRRSHGQMSVCPWCSHNAPHLSAGRLIAALRASRVELALVRSERDTARGEAAREYDRAEASRADVERLREQRGQAVEAMRLCMKDLQEHGVIFAPGDPPYDVLIAYDEESRP